jgi:hypothetical protein
MATENLYASSQALGAIASPSNALGSGTGTWAGTPNENVSTTDIWDMANPTGDVANGTHTVTVVARKGSNTGTPTLQLTARIDGVDFATGSATNITSTTGQNVTLNVNTAGAVDLTTLRVVTEIVAAGGSPSVRNSVEIDTILWSGDFTTTASASITATVVAAAATIGSPTVSGKVFAHPGGPGVNWLRASAVFDGNIDGWTPNQDSTISYDATEGNTTLGSMKVVQTADGTNGPQATVRTEYVHPIRYGDRVVFSMSVKTTTSTQMKLVFRKVGASISVTMPPNTAGVWTRIALDFTHPTGFADYLENIAFGVFSVGADTYWVDDVMVEYKSSQPPSDFVINSAVPCAVSIPSVTVTTSEVRPFGRQNLSIA